MLIALVMETNTSRSRLAESRDMTTTQTAGAGYGRLVDYRTAEVIRAASADEQQASLEAAGRDGGRGVIDVAGRRCYVED